MVPGLFFLVAGVTAEGSCGGEFAEFVTYHVFGDVDGNEFVAVMDSEGMTDEFGGDHRGAAPGFDDVFFS